MHEPCSVCADSGEVFQAMFKLMRVHILAGGRVKRRLRKVQLRWTIPCIECLKGQILKGNWKLEWTSPEWRAEMGL